MTFALPRRFSRGNMFGYYLFKYFFYNLVSRGRGSDSGQGQLLRYAPSTMTSMLLYLDKLSDLLWPHIDVLAR